MWYQPVLLPVKGPVSLSEPNVFKKFKPPCGVLPDLFPAPDLLEAAHDTRHGPAVGTEQKSRSSLREGGEATGGRAKAKPLLSRVRLTEPG